MEDIRDMVLEQSSGGHCCSQIIMELGMRHYGMENPPMIDAVYGLCGGVHIGAACGSLTAAGCLISLVCGAGVSVGLIREFAGWFSGRFGAVDCAEILKADPSLADEHCLSLVVETLEKVIEVIDECRER